MSRQGSARRAVLALTILAVALLWADDQGLRAAATDRADASATPATVAATPATAETTATAKAAPPPAPPKTAATPKAAPQGKGAVPQMTPQEMAQRKIKPAQRQAAADAKKAKRLAAAATSPTAPTLGIAPMAYTGPALVTDSTGALVPDYLGGVTPNWAFSPQPTIDTTTTPWTVTGGGIRKFIDSLPDLTTLIGKPDVVTYPGTEYYEIELIEVNNYQFHTDLGQTTKLRAYQQVNNGTDLTHIYDATTNPTGVCVIAPPIPNGLRLCTVALDNIVAPPPFGYLGPVIVASKGTPTRIKFTNKLPAGVPNGNLFFPTDTTVMGTGTGYDPKSNSAGTYPQNRGTLHLHGGFTPWISDGTPHQWVTPAGEPGNLTTGVSTQPVPDMDLPAGDSMTFYWTNQQSARLMFYHDHAYGITRLNVYAGEAAGYLLVDPVDRALNTSLGVLEEIPLVIQDRTFVWGTRNTGIACGQPDPTATGTFATDPTWCDPIRNWAQTPGSLWFPHVYMPNQNPADITGANAMGRWDYALWFWPPFNGLILNPAVQDPYGPAGQMIPGTPNPSLVPEAFMDTPVVNGTAYPTRQVPAGLVRLRILNAANDRFQNLSLWVAADKTTQTTSTAITGLPTAPTALCNGSAPLANCTEVKMVPFNSSSGPFPINWYTPGNPIVFDDRAGGVPDPNTRGPAMVQIGTEGGLLPQPAVVLNQPVNFTYNPKNIVVLSVEQHALLLGPAERADVLVDFSAFAGNTIILYNDAPAPIPAYDQRLDYYTGGGGLDQTATGGTSMTMPGYGPNTRTIMRFEVAGSPVVGTPDYVNPALCTPVAATSAAGPVACPGPLATALATAFRTSQDPIIVPQSAYNAVYGTSVADAPGVTASRISDTSLTFKPLDQTCLPGVSTPCVLAASASTFQMKPKAIQELFELDYGRMNATLGVELPFTNGGNQTTLPMGYIEPATEILDTSFQILPPSGTDGTQIWKITHNGVDTHAIHVHLFNVQVINRVGWDGAIRLPDLNELGWKETVRMNPLEDIIVALRPTTPQLPFGLPNSKRLMAPALPPNTPIDTFDTLTGNPTTVPNALYDFGWEYVWHCHLLGHEENDMMRPTVFKTPSTVPAAPSPASFGAGLVQWVDPTPINYASLATDPNLGNPQNEIGFRISRSTDGITFTLVGTALANATSYADASAPTSGNCWYNVTAYNAAGESLPATATGTCSGTPLQPVTFLGAPPSSQFGSSFTVTATTTAADATGYPSITGTLGVCNVGAVGGTFQNATALVTMTSGTGTCSLTANWAATATYQAATATQTTVASLASTPAVTFGGAPATAVYNSTFPVTASTTASVMPVISATGVCSVSAVTGTPNSASATVTMTSGTGVCTLTANWPADLNYSAISQSQSTTAFKAATTTTFSSTPNPSVVGQPVTFTFTVTGSAGLGAAAPTGTVSVVASSGETCSATVAAGTCNITFATTGPKTMTATYSGDANYAPPIAASTLTQAVWDFVMGVSPGAQTVNGGQKATYTLTVTSLGSFTGPVALGCTVNQTRYSCSVSPISVTPNGGAKTATVTVTTVKNFGNNYSVSITGKYGSGTPSTGGLTHTITAGLTVKK